MRLIDWINGITKLNKATMDEFQNNIKSAIDDAVADAVAAAKLDAHPIGSYYWSSESTDPSELFGGTWERVKDRFIYALGDTGSAGDTGGSSTHTLTQAEMPRHTHAYPAGNSSQVTSGYYKVGTQTLANYDANVSTAPAGSSQAFSIMPPYITAYCWKRIS